MEKVNNCQNKKQKATNTKHFAQIIQQVSKSNRQRLPDKMHILAIFQKRETFMIPVHIPFLDYGPPILGLLY